MSGRPAHRVGPQWPMIYAVAGATGRDRTERDHFVAQQIPAWNLEPAGRHSVRPRAGRRQKFMRGADGILCSLSAGRHSIRIIESRSLARSCN